MKIKAFYLLSTAIFFAFLSLSSCDSNQKVIDSELVGQAISLGIDKYGVPTSIDTVSCWLIGEGNRVEIASGKVYDFYLNPEDPQIKKLTHRDKENRQLRRHSMLSILDVRLLMTEEDISYLKKEVIKEEGYYYYNFGNDLRVKVVEGRIVAVDKGLLNDLLVLDKIRLNLGEGNMFVINITLAFIMFGVALNMNKKGFKLVLIHPKALFVGVLSQFLLLPALTYVLILILKPSPSIALGMVLVAACPGGNVSNFICSLAKGNLELSVAMTAVATIAAVVMTPINFAFWGGLYASSSGLVVPINIDWWQMSKVVLLLLGLPIALGMTVRRFFPKVAKKMDTPMRYFSILFFIALVLGAIVQNYTYFSVYVKLVVGIVLLHNLLAFATGFSFSTLMGLAERDRRSITIETGIQNSGLALVLIVNPNLFNGLGGMAFIAAFWGVWHIVSGMLIGGYWNYRTKKIIK